MKKNNLDKILSLVIAIILWAYVIYVDNPPGTQLIKNIPVALSGAEELEGKGLALAGDGNYTVDVVIKGQRMDLSAVLPEEISATADISSLEAGQNYIDVNVKVPSVVSVSEVRSEKIQVYADKLVAEDKPVKIVVSGQRENLEACILDLGEQTMKVRGAKILVDAVSELRVDLSAESLMLDDPTDFALTAYPADSEGNVQTNVAIEDPEVIVRACLYRTKSVPFSVKTVGEPGLGAQVMNIDVPTQLIIKGPSQALSAIERIEAAPVDISGITENTAFPLDVTLPEGVMFASSSAAAEARFTLMQIGEISFTYEAAEIVARNLGEGLDASFSSGDEAICVTARGDLNIIRELTAVSLQPAADLLDMGIGEHSGIVLGSLRASDSSVSITVTPAEVSVVISEAQTFESVSE